MRKNFIVTYDIRDLTFQVPNYNEPPEFDLTQVALGSCGVSDVAASVVATVVSASEARGDEDHVGPLDDALERGGALAGRAEPGRGAAARAEPAGAAPPEDDPRVGRVALERHRVGVHRDQGRAVVLDLSHAAQGVSAAAPDPDHSDVRSTRLHVHPLSRADRGGEESVNPRRRVAA